MEVIKYLDSKHFLEDNLDFLLKSEALNGLLYGRVLHIGARPEEEEKSHFFAVRKASQTCMVAIQTHPFSLILSQSEEKAAPNLLINYLIEKNLHFPGVIGPRDTSLTFAKVWKEKLKQDYHIQMQQLVYQLDEVSPARRAEGSIRMASLKDLELVADWLLDFDVKAMGGSTDKDQAIEKSTHKIKAQEVFLWEYQGQVVSMAARARPTQNGISVNYVYTPAEHRRRGYAEACVATLSQQLLDEGFRFCTLFTDENFGTSNRVYQKIGYYQIGAFYNIEF